MGFEALKYLGFMFIITLNIDFMRQVVASSVITTVSIDLQKHMKYRIKVEVDRRKRAELGLPDYSKLPLGSKLEIFATLGTQF